MEYNKICGKDSIRYAGTERICSRLGDQTFSLSSNVAFTPQTQQRLGIRIMQVDQDFRAELLELVEAGDVPVEFPNVLNLITLLPAGSNANSNPNPNSNSNPHSNANTSNDIFYYHTNHLGSTAFVTDGNATVTQGFLYAPFGEITTEYAPMWQNGVLPKYSFNAKELDEETGMYYYEARYYKPPVFVSRDPLFEQKPWLSPYHYCSNNPVGRVDPTGMMDGWVQDEDGNVFWDNNTNSQSEFEHNYSNRPGCAYVSDADNPKSYTLPSGEGRLEMNEWFAPNDVRDYEGVGGVKINISFIANDKNAEVGWTQTYSSNMSEINDAVMYTQLPEANCREYLDGGTAAQTCNPNNSGYFDINPNKNLWDAPTIARNDGAQYDPTFRAQSTLLLNKKRVLSIGWGYSIDSHMFQTIYAPTILHSTSSFHNAAVNNIINK